MKQLRFFSALVLAMTVTLGAAADDAFKVIAHSSVPLTSVSAKELSPLFLKKVTNYGKWGAAAQKVLPVDLGAESDTREAFSKSVHGKAITAVRAFWQQQIFSGRGNPPAELASDAEVIAFVAKTPGAIGYVSSGASIPSSVKQVRVTR